MRLPFTQKNTLNLALYCSFTPVNQYLQPVIRNLCFRSRLSCWPQLKCTQSMGFNGQILISRHSQCGFLMGFCHEQETWTMPLAQSPCLQLRLPPPAMLRHAQRWRILVVIDLTLPNQEKQVICGMRMFPNKVYHPKGFRVKLQQQLNCTVPFPKTA